MAMEISYATDDSSLGLDKTSFVQWLEIVKGDNKAAIEKFMADGDNRQRVLTAPGSRSAHHAWRGGYQEHLRQTFMIASHNLELMERIGRMDELPDHEKFSLSDAIVVMFLHDIEKPFVYKISDNGMVATDQLMDKAQRRKFRADVIDRYGFALTTTMANALQFVEGERDADYVPGGRAEQPLASLCQVADNFSARGLYDHGRPGGEA